MKLEGQDYSKPPVPEPYVHLLNAYGSLVNFLVPLFCYRLFFAVSCRYSSAPRGLPLLSMLIGAQRAAQEGSIGAKLDT